VDDRRADYDRSASAPLHEPRIPAGAEAPAVRGENLPMLHLQWLIPQRNQLKQAWYRCRELLDGRDAAAINEFYAVTFHDRRVATSPVPPEWTADITFPVDGGDLAPSWHQRDILAWFDHYGVERFEPLEIWHVPILLQEFRRRVGRAPRPDRSYPAALAGARATLRTAAVQRGAAPDADLMARPFLTVLTTPVPGGRERLIRGVRRRVRRFVKPGVPLPSVSPYPGHFAVVRSVVEGLRAIGADFNFNPGRLSELARVVYAPANEALRQAAALKRQARIDYLVAGPVNALFVDECDGILRMPEIDRIIVAHEWALEFLRDAPALLAKSIACPCGVDTEVWTPSSGGCDTPIALVYWKSGDEAFCDRVEQIVRACGLEPRRVRALHGEHAMFSPADYRRLLDQSAIAVFLSAFETQGLALAEAWSMDVPTIAWDPQGVAQWRDRSFESRSSAPYLTPATGRLWRTIDELEPVLARRAGGSSVVPPARLDAREHDRCPPFGRAAGDHPRRRGAGASESVNRS